VEKLKFNSYSKEEKMEGFKTTFINEEQLPLLIQSARPSVTKNEFFDLVSSQKASLKEKLLKYGGVLFRGFPLESAGDFASFIRLLETGEMLDYIGGDSPRNKIKEGVYTSTEAPPSFKIPLHNELSFVKYHPRHIYFFCETPSTIGGETIIADARKVYEGVDSTVKERFMDKGLRYVSCYYYKSKMMNWLNKVQRSHKSWIQVFETESKEEVEKKCLEQEFEYEWTKNGWLRISQVRPPIKEHPQTGEKVWFNQAHLYDFNPKLLGTWRYVGAKLFYFREHTRLHEVFYSDHSHISRADLYHIMDVLDAHTIAFPWQKGDVLVLDNILAMHGRAPFEGKRRILAAMTS
jgi:alpha-ketoglutarate-dependent taurine dioxygenase